jgi:hypothetical protein
VTSAPTLSKVGAMRNPTIASLAGYLLSRNINAVVVQLLLQAFNTANCVQPLPASQVDYIINSICKREMQKRGHYEQR